MAAPPPTMPGYMNARVKSVLSGDTVVLVNIQNPTKERIMSLAYVTAPRLKREGDEAFAFASRDHLRKLLVGKNVFFRPLYTVPTTKREYGLLAIPGSNPVISFPERSVAEGLARIRENADRKDGNQSDEATRVLEKLQVAEARAKADEKGIWAEKGGNIACSHETGNAQELVDKFKGKQVDGIIERVLSGDRLIVRILTDKDSHVQTMVLVAGIKAPATKRPGAGEGQETPAEPFGEEAQTFLETRLLQRDVHLEILGLSPQGQLIATVKHPTQGSIAPHLLKAGLARCTDFHSAMLGGDMAALRAAEKEAKDNKKGQFHAHTGKASGGAGEFDATVSRVFSADTLYLRNKVGAERRVSLSSVRQPKQADPKQQPWIAEAKEFLRKKLIGKHVKCHIDGKRAATEGYEEREMGTVNFGGKNIALLLVESGLCSVIRHRQDDPDRSPDYDALLQAEATAQKEQKGIWSSNVPSVKKYIDYSESAEKAKRQLGILSRQKKIPAIVDYVKAGSRFTILIPREDAKITLVLAGVRAPRSARNANEQSEPFGQEAHDFANKRCLQRDVEIDVDDIDKVGGFIGTLFVGRENFSKLLLEEGFASVNSYSAEKSGHAVELFAAEKKAKEAKKGLWENYDPTAENADAEEGVAPNASTDAGATSNGTNGKKNDYRDVMVTHVDESGHLKLQQVGPGTAALDRLMTQFRSFHITSRPSLTSAPRVGDVVAAKFSLDGSWYRAKIRRNDRDAKTSEVIYVDYGNSETLPWSSLRALSSGNPPADFSLQGLKAQATDATLSYVQLPGNAEYLKEAINYLMEETDGRTLVARVDYIEPAAQGGSLSVTLFDPERSQKVAESLNAELVGEGWALVPRKMKAWEAKSLGTGDEGKKVMQVLRGKESEAKESRKGMWEYGDISADD